MSLKTNEVIKHSAAVHISNNVTLLQRRMWNVMLANAFDNLDKNEFFSISISKLLNVLDYNSKNISHLKECLESLVETKIKWNVFHKDGKNEWGVTSLLSGASIIDGVIKYSYSYELRQKLYNPVMYTKLSLIIQNKFSSKHSLCLYELFLDYFDIKRNAGETHWITIIELRTFLGLSENEYQRFADLSHYVLKKSINEINEISDLSIEYKTKRFKNKITDIKFFITKKNDNKPFIDVEFKEVDDINSGDENYCLNILINEYGIEISLANNLINKYGEHQIFENINYVKNYKKKISNIPGFVVKAIENNWQISSSLINKKENNQNIVENKIDSIERIKSELNLQRKNRVQDIYSKLSEDQINSLKNEYICKIESGEYGLFLQKTFKMSGFNGPGVSLQFHSVFLQNKFLNNTLEEELVIHMDSINKI